MERQTIREFDWSLQASFLQIKQKHQKHGPWPGAMSQGLISPCLLPPWNSYCICVMKPTVSSNLLRDLLCTDWLNMVLEIRRELMCKQGRPGKNLWFPVFMTTLQPTIWSSCGSGLQVFSQYLCLKGSSVCHGRGPYLGRQEVVATGHIAFNQEAERIEC